MDYQWSDRLDYLNFKDEHVRAFWDGDGFSHWTEHSNTWGRSPNMDYKSWDGELWSVTWDSAQREFVHRRGGHVSRTIYIDYKTWNGTKVRAVRLGHKGVDGFAHLSLIEIPPGFLELLGASRSPGIPILIPAIPPPWDILQLPRVVAPKSYAELFDLMLGSIAGPAAAATLSVYLTHLKLHAKDRLRPLPGSVLAALSPHYKTPLSEVRFADSIPTIHRAAITVGKTVYFPRPVDLTSFDDLHWMCHELQHCDQYTEAGSEEAFFLRYFGQATIAFFSTGSFNVHDDLALERVAEEKALSLDAVIATLATHR